MSSPVATLITPAFDAPFQFVDVFPLGLKWAESHNHFKVQSWLRARSVFESTTVRR